MGVKYLWSIIRNTGQADVPKNKRLAIDTSIWLHYYKNVPLDIFIYNTIKRILKLLYNNNKPIFIFDTATPYQKKKTVEDRKKREVVALARKYVQNVKCKICNIPYRECEHANVEVKEEIEKANQLIKTRIREKRNKNWGITYDDEMKILDDEKFEKMTKLQKLQSLINLRHKRKLPSKMQANDGLEFSISQINNVRKRNRVNELIDKLEQRNNRRIMSDCSKMYTFENKFEDEENDSEEIDISKIFEPEICIDHKEEFVGGAEGTSEDEHIDENIFLISESQEHEDGYEYDSLEIEDDYDSDDSLETYKNNIYTQEEDDTMLQDSSLTREEGHAILQDSEHQIPANEELNIKIQEDIKNTQKDTNAKIADHSNLDEVLDKSASADKKPDNEGDMQTKPEDAVTDSTYNDIIDKLEKHEKYDTDTPEPVKYIAITENDMSEDVRSLTNTIKEILDAFDITYIDAPMEADSQCAYLNAADLVDGVITEDNDIFLYGGKVVYKNYFKRNANVIKYDIDKIATVVSRDDMIKLGYYLGSDYTNGQMGIGPKKAITMLSQEIVDDGEYESINNLYLNPYVHKYEAIQWKPVKKRKVKTYIVNAAIASSKKDELLHYADKLPI